MSFLIGYEVKITQKARDKKLTRAFFN